MIYLDHNATSPVRPEVLKAIEPFGSDHFGNPSSPHSAGRAAARALKEARKQTALFLGAEDSEIIFTSGGTESNNAAFRSALWTERGKNHVLTTAVEHSSVLKLVCALEEEGIHASLAPVSEKGRLDVQTLLDSVTEKTALVSVMMANNETGNLFPIEGIGNALRARKVLFHVDAVQTAGKIDFSFAGLPVDFLSLSAHKLGGPKGAGVLCVKKNVPFRPFCFGGGQERGRRAGTENVPGIVGLGAACRLLRTKGKAESEKMRTLRDLFENKIFEKLTGVQINGDPENRLPNTSNLAFQGTDQEALLILLDEEGVCASSGSACISGAPEPSHVLRAMGLSRERARSSVRFSFGPENSEAEVDTAVQILSRLVSRLRNVDLKEQHPHPRN